MAVMTAAADVALPARQVDAPAFAWSGYSVIVTPSLARVDAAWQTLEMLATAPMFQGRAFAAAWLRAAAAASGEEPIYVAGYRGDEPAFVLAMALTRTFGARTLTWLGQSHANYGMGVLHPELISDFERGELDVDALITTIGRQVGADIVHLDHQPLRWAGRINPFALSARAMRSANDTFVLSFEPDFERHYKRLFSSRTVSNMKRKQRKLEEMGNVVFARPCDATPRSTVLDWFFVNKTTQLAQSGRASPFEDAHIQDLYRLMARDVDQFDIDELSVGPTRVAMGMTARDGATAYLLNSLHHGAEFARSSPGALLLHRMVAQSHAAGARVYDFGPGELPYKLEWEPEVVPLMFSTHLINPVSIVAYAMLVFLALAKAKAKRSPQISDWVRRIRLATAKAG